MTKTQEKVLKEVCEECAKALASLMYEFGVDTFVEATIESKDTKEQFKLRIDKIKTK